MYSKEANRPSNLQPEAAISGEAGQILHLKRLLVTLKQHYEKSLHSSQIQLQAEQNQRVALQKEFDKIQLQLLENEKLQEEEIQSLRSQQTSLKELLKKTQEDLKQIREQNPHQKTDHTTCQLQIEQLFNQIDQSQKQVCQLEQELLENKQRAQREIDRMKSLLEAQKHKGPIETVLSTSSFHQHMQEIQEIRQKLDERVRERDFVQDKYEQLKDEWNQLGERLEEAVEARTQAEHYLLEVKTASLKQEADLKEFTEQLANLQEEKKNLESERDQLKILLDESETRLKVAQQHLAKKVKESALLNERVEEQQLSLSDLTQILNQQKMQSSQLQASLELYQKQEKKLQEQLHDALKGTESQVAKWEEKYFRMYDKWQESENKIIELKKFEEKHHQMQHLLANLGNFMGGSFNQSPSNTQPPLNYQAAQETVEKNLQPVAFEAPFGDENLPLSSKEEDEERYDLFGMRQPQDKYKPKHFA